MGAVDPPREVLRTPVIGDIDGDLEPEIVDTAGEHVYAWNTDGSEVSGFPVRVDPALSAVPLRTKTNHIKRGFGGAPVLGDLIPETSGERKLEIVATALDQHVYAFNGSGNSLAGFPKKLREPGSTLDGAEIINTPALGDIDGNDGGRPEIVVPTNEVGDPGSGAAVEKRDLQQWFLRITDYAEQLVEHIKQIESTWPEKVLKRQSDWVGRSKGAFVDFPVKGSKQKIRVFTTRIDTIHGATAVVLSPDHPLLAELLTGSVLKDELDAFAARTRAERMDRAAADEEQKEGMNTGILAINPFNDETVPVWVANYVVMEYGTGAVMSVPAHDERDYEFAQKYSLPIRRVIERISQAQEEIPHDPLQEDQSQAMPHAFTEYGILVNSGDWSGKLSADAMTDMATHAEQHRFGEAAVTYRIRDWGVSRQRFWGAPVPIVYCEKCGTVPVPEKDLPVKLPDHAEFTGSGESPLAGVEEFVNTTCPRCGGPGRRETDTMDTFVDSSWYFFRYTDPQNESMPFDPAVAQQWTPVDQYIGGDSHAVMHLIYTRFWTKFMRDIGLVTFDEPVKRLLTQGMVTNRVEGTDEWKAMSKSLGNGVDPDEMIAAFGADAARLFILFAAPVENELRWSETGIEGAVRFLRRVYTMVWRWNERLSSATSNAGEAHEFSTEARQLRRKTHQTIAKVTRGFRRTPSEHQRCSVNGVV